MSELPIALKYQQAWLEDQSNVKVAVKSRRIGLTWIEACDAVLLAGAEKESGGNNYLYISTKYELAKEFIDTAADWVRWLSPAVESLGEVEELLLKDDDKDIKTFVISFASGFKIYALSSRPSNMRGMQGTVCIDEAAHQDKLPDLLKAAFAMLMWGSKLRIISTHHGENNDFNQLVQAIKRGENKFSLHEYPIDYAVANGLYKRICEVNGLEWSEDSEKQWLEELIESYGEFAAEELFCQPSEMSGQYFNREVIESAARPEFTVLRFKCSQNFINKDKPEQAEVVEQWLETTVRLYIDGYILRNYSTYAGLDFGRSHDLTVLSILFEDYDKTRYVPLMLELRNVPFHCQEQICKYVFSRVKKFKKAAFDATGNGSYLAEALTLEFGARKIEAVKLNTNEYLTRFPRYKAAIGAGSLTIPDDEDIINDHFAVQIVEGVPKVPQGLNFKGKDKQPRHGDAAISLMLAWSATPPEKRRKIVHLNKSRRYYDYSNNLVSSQ